MSSTFSRHVNSRGSNIGTKLVDAKGPVSPTGIARSTSINGAFTSACNSPAFSEMSQETYSFLVTFVISNLVPEDLMPYSSEWPFYGDSERVSDPTSPPIIPVVTSKVSFSVVFFAISPFGNSVWAMSTAFLSIVVMSKFRFARAARVPSSFGTLRASATRWSCSRRRPVAAKPTPEADVFRCLFSIVARSPVVSAGQSGVRSMLLSQSLSNMG